MVREALRQIDRLTPGQRRQARRCQVVIQPPPHVVGPGLAAVAPPGVLLRVGVELPEHVHPEQYTWWSNRGQARANNVGWRLDYHLATPGLAALARREHIYLEQRFSDHAPLTIDYDFEL